MDIYAIIIIYESLYYSHVKHSAESIISSVTQAWGVFGHRHILTPWLGKDSCRPFGPLQYFPQKYALTRGLPDILLLHDIRHVE